MILTTIIIALTIIVLILYIINSRYFFSNNILLLVVPGVRTNVVGTKQTTRSHKLQLQTSLKDSRFHSDQVSIINFKGQLT